MKGTKQYGGVLIYSVVSIVFLSAVALFLQSLIVPALTLSLGSRQLSELDYLVGSYESVVWQQKNSFRAAGSTEAEALKSTVKALNNRAVRFEADDRTTWGVVTGKLSNAQETAQRWRLKASLEVELAGGGSVSLQRTFYFEK